MTSVSVPSSSETGNITVRRGPSTTRQNMAHPLKPKRSYGQEGSIYIDSILSQDEAKDIVSMMIMANEYDKGRDNHISTFCTSSQMGGRDQQRRPISPPLSPLGSPGPLGRSLPATPKSGDACNLGHIDERNSEPKSKFDVRGENEKNKASFGSVYKSDLNDSCDPVIGLLGSVAEYRSKNSLGEACLDLHVTEVEQVAKERNMATAGVVKEGAGEDVVNIGEDVVNVDGNKGVGSGIEDVNNAGSSDPDAEDGSKLARRSPSSPSPTQSPVPTTPASPDGEETALNVVELIAKLETVDELAKKADRRSKTLGKTVRDLENSLQFSQHEIDALKTENAELKRRIGTVETEDRRTQFQVNLIEDKTDRLETMVKKRNLIIEGIPEQVDGRENVEGTVCNMIDQLTVHKGIVFEACFRVGAFNKHRTRPIQVVFEKQSDKDLIYSKRMDLRRTADYQRVWVNEDLGPLSKKKRNLIRLISREAQQQGIDCRTGKYSLFVEKKKYDHTNLDELPPKLQLAHLKQVQIDDKTIAYQSEYAPLSNFFPCEIKIGSHVFFCLE